MKEIHTEIEIAAPVEKVWAALTAFDIYGEWNPFIPKLSGRAQLGERLTVRIEPPGSKGMTFRPVVLAADPPRELRWKGRLLIPGLFDGEHCFQLEALDPFRTKLVQKERFSGILVPLFGKGLTATHRGFELMNQTLKARVEAAKT